MDCCNLDDPWFWIQLLIALLLLGLALLVLWLRWRKGRKEYEKQRCIEIPPDVVRRPDPCLYSQPYLMAKGLAVTWDNPDIQVTDLGGTPVPSSNLQPNTDYIVAATIHNASFDAALGVEVRCVYRPFSFGTPDRVPVETDANGNPAVRIVHIGPWGAAIAKFRWHTPASGGHFCLQVECYHPADREPNNNIGQENTDVRTAASDVNLVIPLFNARARHAQAFIFANEYAIAEADVRLRLHQIRGYKGIDRPTLRAAAGAGTRGSTEELMRAAERDALRGSRIRLAPNPGGRGSRGVGYRVYGYDGFQQLSANHALGGFSLRDGWTLDVDNAQRQGDAWQLDVPPKGSLNVALRLQVPDDAPAGQRKAVNIWATDRFGALLGGVTIHVRKGP